MSGRITFEFHDLPGIAGGRAVGVALHSITAIVEGLRWNRLVWDSGEDGLNIIVYRDDAQLYRCFLHQRLTPLAMQTCIDGAELRDWLHQHHPRLRPTSERTAA